MLIHRKKFNSFSAILMIRLCNIISQLKAVIGLSGKTLIIGHAPGGRSNFLMKEPQGNAESYNQLIRLFSYQVIDYRERTVEEAPTIRFYGVMIVSLMVSNIAHLIVQALIYTGGIIVN